MNAYFDEITAKLGFAPEESVCDKITVLGWRGLLVEGHRGLVSYSAEEIRVRLKKRLLKIEGEKLEIAEISKDEIYIKGKVLSVGVDLES